MFNSTWIGIINWDNGIYYNNVKNANLSNNKTSNYKSIKDNTKKIDKNKDKIESKKIDSNKIESTKIDSNKIQTVENSKDTNKDTIENVSYFDFKNSRIPYYNENIEYLQSNHINNNKYDNNYYKLLDRMGNISRFILKGNDYYKLYISKNSNKYFNNVEEKIEDNTKQNDFNSLQNDNLKNTKQFSKINIVYQEIERQPNNENDYNEEYL
jgi:hypothetical protein